MSTPGPDRTAAIEAYYRQHHQRLEGRVAARVSGLSPDLIEEACQYAWTALLRRPDVRLTHDGGGVGWLVMVATQEAWRAARPKDVPTGAYALAGDRGVIAEPGAHSSSALDEIDVRRQRLRATKRERGGGTHVLGDQTGRSATKKPPEPP